jgi:hypothetical protein
MVPHINNSLRSQIVFRLFQASMWRTYAGECLRHGRYGLGPAWMRNVARKSREECLRRSRLNARLAHRLNMRAALLHTNNEAR